jgi:hypothetical protein
MARGKVNKLYRTFAKGLITEAGPLTYPENASLDELNTILKRKGSRSRRFGIEYEPGFTAGVDTGSFGAASISVEYVWHTVASDASINFLCVQSGDTIRFFDMAERPIIDGLKSFTIDLTDHKVATASNIDVRTTPCQMVGGKGFLFVCQEYIEPFVIEYDPDTDTISTTTIIIQIRDYDGVDDGLANDEEPTTLTAEHLYNLRNQGWVGPGTGTLGPTGPTPVPPPPPSGDPGYYDPWSGEFRTVSEGAIP